MNHQAEENIMVNIMSNNNNAAGAASNKMMDDDVDDGAMKFDLHRCITAGSSSTEQHDTSCDQAKNQAPPISTNDTTTDDTAMASNHMQALAHLYHSSRRSRNFRSVPSNPSAITYAQGDTNGASIHQARVEDEAPTTAAAAAAGVEWSFEIASLMNDDCSSASSFDGEESFIMDSDNIFRIESDCWKTNELKSSSSGTAGNDGLQTNVEGRSFKRMRTT